MMELSQTALFIGSIINLYALVLILRAWLQFARVDYYNPVSTFAVKMTDPVLKPLRKIAPTVKNIDTSALLLIFIIGMLKGIIYFGLSVNVLLVLGVLTVLKSIGLAIFYVFFKNGEKIAEVIGTPKEAIDDGTLGNRTINSAI